MTKASLRSILVAVVVLVTAVIAEAQHQAKVAKIGWLGLRTGSEGEAGGRGRTLRILRERGYIEGKNIVFEYRTAENKPDRLPSIADELVGLKVDAIVAFSSFAAFAAKNATRTIPIVFLLTVDPVAAGLVDSLARPGGNITGFTTMGSELVGKRLELLKETVPKLSRVAVLWNLQGATPQEWKESQLPARELGLQIHSMEIQSAADIDDAFKGAIKARSAGLVVTQSALVNSNLKKIADLATRHQLPAIYGRADFVDSGGLISYGADQEEPYRRLAYYIDRILKGTKPADLPVERPMKFEMVINFKTAKALGLTIPPIVLMRATRVVK